MPKLESRRDAEGNELRPVYAIARSDLENEEPDGWAINGFQAARIINKALSESGSFETMKGSDLYWSRPLSAWFTEE